MSFNILQMIYFSFVWSQKEDFKKIIFHVAHMRQSLSRQMYPIQLFDGCEWLALLCLFLLIFRDTSQLNVTTESQYLWKKIFSLWTSAAKETCHTWNEIQFCAQKCRYVTTFHFASNLSCHKYFLDCYTFFFVEN